jgi:hypothetical protein
MIHTIYNVLFPHRLHSFLNQCLVAVLNVSGEFLGPQCAECALDFAKYRFDRVVVRRVGHVVNVAEAQLPHRCLALF